MLLDIMVIDHPTYLDFQLLIMLESTLNPGLVDNPLITIIPLPPPPRILRSKTLPFALAGPLKVLWQIGSLFYTLSYVIKPARWLLVQVGWLILASNHH
jgi:hypothetical protein